LVSHKKIAHSYFFCYTIAWTGIFLDPPFFVHPHAMPFSILDIQAFFPFKKIPTLRDVVFFFIMFFAVISPVFLIALYFESFDSAGFQFTLFLYIIVICSTILIAFGIARVFLLINGYRQRERIFLESIGDGVCGIDNKGTIILWNTAAEIISGFSKKEMRHAPLTHFFSLSKAQNKTKENELINDILTASRPLHISSRLTLKTKNNHPIPIDATAAPIMDRHGVLQGAIIVFRDMTREQKIDRVKDEFVSLVSHELRTPLTNMNWRIEMLRDGEAGKLTEKQREYLSKIDDGARRMTDLVNLFLNVSRIHLRTLNIVLKPHAIRALVSEALEEYTQRMTQKKLIFKKKISQTITTFLCDQRIFLVILQNIIANAIEYTPAGGTITLHAKKENAHIIISVTDSGIGIPKKDQSKIFSKLFRAENTRTTYPDGNGLGLYLVKLLIDECGGDIWFISEEEEGTTFFISFPLSGMRKKKGTRSLITTPRP